MDNILEGRIEKLIEPVWFIQPHFVEDKGISFNKIESQFGGSPYLQLNESLPVCASCDTPLDFIFQLDLSQWQGVKNFKFSFINLFYCWECMPLTPEFNGEKDPMKSLEIRTYRKATLEKYKPIEIPMESVTLTGDINFSEGELLPDYKDLEKIDEVLYSTINELSQKANLNEVEYWENLVEAACGTLDSYSFIGGYPQWINKPNIPECEVCAIPMKFVCQIDSHEEIDLIWGDKGCMYLFSCEKHNKNQKAIIQY